MKRPFKINLYKEIRNLKIELKFDFTRGRWPSGYGAVFRNHYSFQTAVRKSAGSIPALLNYFFCKFFFPPLSAIGNSSSMIGFGFFGGLGDEGCGFFGWGGPSGAE